MACSPLASIRQVLELGHPFVPTHRDAVEGLHLPGVRPVHAQAQPEENEEVQDRDDASDESHAGRGEAGPVQGQILQAQNQQAPVVNPHPNPNANAAHGGDGFIKAKLRALAAAFRRLFPVMVLERWIRQVIRNQ
ncbi:hypothetical protein JR316_0002505 [Psilocybe cubensis]|uniref:Uncharacterized protein n=1 Tax=Psilocybe cubensis TaxID=181762 RepID=A0ACB8HCZ0_PSICU|nr:hypothetical protein JR316_0002505 [Psilocybe cubensis]KAH9485595.1 hypothetical protein JR316_0002505 [Psilocybe cubensis]